VTTVFFPVFLFFFAILETACQVKVLLQQSMGTDGAQPVEIPRPWREDQHPIFFVAQDFLRRDRNSRLCNDGLRNVGLAGSSSMVVPAWVDVSNIVVTGGGPTHIPTRIFPGYFVGELQN